MPFLFSQLSYLFAKFSAHPILEGTLRALMGKAFAHILPRPLLCLSERNMLYRQKRRWDFKLECEG